MAQMFSRACAPAGRIATGPQAEGVQDASLEQEPESSGMIVVADVVSTSRGRRDRFRIERCRASGVAQRDPSTPAIAAASRPHCQRDKAVAASIDARSVVDAVRCAIEVMTGLIDAQRR